MFLKNGICNNAVRKGCTSGTSNDEAYSDTGTHYRWRCDGLNRGSNSGMNTITKIRIRQHEGEIYAINGNDYFVTPGHPFMTSKGWVHLMKI